MGRNNLNESLGVSDIVLQTAREIVSKIQYYEENGESEDYIDTDEFTRVCFSINKVGFIGELWVNSIHYKDVKALDDEQFSAQVPFYDNDDLLIKNGYLYHADEYSKKYHDGEGYLELTVYYCVDDILLENVVHEVKHLYYSYMSKLKNIKQDKFYEDGVRNSDNPLGTFIYLTNIDEIQAYTHDSYIQFENGVDVKDTKLYDLFDFISNFEITDYKADIFSSITNDEVKNPKKYLEKRKQQALKIIQKNLGRIMAKAMNNQVKESKKKRITITDTQFKFLMEGDSKNKFKK